jgi:hypothetical protein
LLYIKGGNTMHEFFNAALPWAAIAVAIAIIMTYSDAARQKKEKDESEK